MANLTTHAIVLRHADYREADRIVTLFSPTLGRIDALCRGCRRQKSPLLAASEVFASGEYVLWQRPERCTVVSCQLSDSFYPLREDFERLSHAMYLSELCLGVIQEDQENQRLFLLLLQSLAHLAYGIVPQKRVTSVFLMGLLSLSGYRPSVGRCQHCGKALSLGEGAVGVLSAQHGGVLCPECGKGITPKLDATALLGLQQIMRRGIASLDEASSIPDAVFDALRRMAQTRLEIQPKAGKLLE